MLKGNTEFFSFSHPEEEKRNSTEFLIIYPVKCHLIIAESFCSSRRHIEGNLKGYLQEWAVVIPSVFMWRHFFLAVTEKNTGN